MGTELRKLLDNAKGTDEHVVAIVVDIRGFTPFCKEEESINVANFLKRVYIKIIDDYFPKASFYKPTGDGLLIVITYTANSLKDVVTNTMTNCLNLLEDFKKLREGDNMIYFPTPENVGIGISRGAACCISSDGTVIDYSGRVINLASRLNDFARPSGIVFDSSLGLTLLPNEIQGVFLCDNVYVRGIAESKPIAVYFTKQHTIIPPSRKVPLKEPEWSAITYQDSFKTLRESSSGGDSHYVMEINKPLDEKQIHVNVSFKIGTQVKLIFLDMTSRGVKYVHYGKGHYVEIAFPVLIEELSKKKLQDDTIVIFEVSYPAT